MFLIPRVGGLMILIIEKYHSAVGKYTNTNILDSEFKTEEIKDITIIHHNICDGIRKEFLDCDCIYSEISWKNGYSKFIENTIAGATTFFDYINSINSVIKLLKLPTFILCGSQIIRYLEPDDVINISFKFHNNYKTCFALFNVDHCLDYDSLNEFDIRDYVANKYTNILDFSCGYGIILNSITKYNKKAVVSDINTNCLRYIKEALSDE
jgi:hypothetical protein